MTINHVFLPVPSHLFNTVRTFYIRALAPIGYKELLRIAPTYTGIGSDYPYLFLKGIDTQASPQSHFTTHIAFDAPTDAAVDEFWKLSLEMGAKDNGKPGIREEMSKQPYYAAFVIDPMGNNLEVVCVDKTGF